MLLAIFIFIFGICCILCFEDSIDCATLFVLGLILLITWICIASTLGDKFTDTQEWKEVQIETTYSFIVDLSTMEIEKVLLTTASGGKVKFVKLETAASIQRYKWLTWPVDCSSKIKSKWVVRSAKEES